MSVSEVEPREFTTRWPCEHQLHSPKCFLGLRGKAPIRRRPVKMSPPFTASPARGAGEHCGRRAGAGRGLGGGSPWSLGSCMSCRSLARQLETSTLRTWSLGARFWTMGTLVSGREWTEGGSRARHTLGTGVWSSHYGQRRGSGLSGQVPAAATTAGSHTGAHAGQNPSSTLKDGAGGRTRGGHAPALSPQVFTLRDSHR